MLHFLFPENPLEEGSVDPHFAAQESAFGDFGFSTSLCSEEALAGRERLRNISENATVIYRGWMMRDAQYIALERAIAEAGAAMLVSLKDYFSAHHLPNWYSLIEEFTPETHFFPVDADIVAELRKLKWGRYFLKDHVKSLKTSRGSILDHAEDAISLLEEMRMYRGEIEGGICVRRVEQFIPETESRYFVLERQSYAAPNNREIPEIVRRCAERISSPFFSVDVVMRRDGVLRVVEIGDGQVSDLVGWSPAEFAGLWQHGFQRDK